MALLPHHLIAAILLIFNSNEGLSSIIHFGRCTLILSAPCSNDYVRFFLYTRNNVDSPQFVTFGDQDNLTSSFYSAAAKNKVIIHGYNADMFLDALINIKNGYLNTSETNIWMVDWAKISVAPCYISAVYNTRYVGKCIAQFIQRLQNSSRSADFHIIGFSLGAHVPASTSEILKPYKVSRVTGLDPAMPLIMFESKSHKLSPDDAHYVDVIHTNGLIQGQLEPSGHSDFYMNGGLIQPGCSSETSPLNCDHHRAPEYFAESITSSIGFWGWACSNYIHYILGYCPQKDPPILMGEYIDTKSRGTFIVQTESESPFAMGKWDFEEKNGNLSDTYQES